MHAHSQLKCLFHVSLNISNTLVDVHTKFHKRKTLIAQCALMCSCVCTQFTLRVNNNCQSVCKQCSIPVNNNKATPIIHYKGEILLHITGHPDRYDHQTLSKY